MTCNKVNVPLRYPGSKACLTDYIAAIIEENFLSGCTVYEPFAGSAVISLEMVERGFAGKAVLVERDPLIYCFWNATFSHNEELCEAINNLNIDIETWGQYKSFRDIEDPKGHPVLQLGLAGLFFNRTNFSGIIGAGPIGGYKQQSEYHIDCRFNKQRLIAQIRSLAYLSEKVEVVFGDAMKFMSENESDLVDGFAFVYVDPPYYSQGKKLYRYYYNDNDHENLANFLLDKDFPWLVSYEDHPKIRSLYAKKHFQPIYVDYSAKKSRKGSELLISNLVIPPLVYEEAHCSKITG
jgi:DNA adenine methylase